MPTMMIVDDEALSRFSLRTIISQAFADISIVAEAENGQDAIEGFERSRPDAVLMDVRLPDMSGITASERILERYPTAKIVICTAYDNFSFISHALDIGVKGFLLKPVRREEIVEKIGRLFAAEPTLIERLAEQKLLEQMIGDAISPEMLRQLDSYYAGLDDGVMLVIRALDAKHTEAMLKKLMVALPGSRRAFACMRGENGCLFAAQEKSVEHWCQLAQSIAENEPALKLKWAAARVRGQHWAKSYQALSARLDAPAAAAVDPEEDEQASLKDRLYEQLAFPDTALKDMSLEKLAEAMDVSAQYLSMAFKELTGQNFIGYITGRRMDYAARLLREGRRPEEVAGECGYGDHAYFKRLFKKTFGVSPREYARGRNG